MYSKTAVSTKGLPALPFRETKKFVSAQQRIITTVLRGTIHSKHDQILLVEIGKHRGFCLHRRSYLIWSPVIVQSKHFEPHFRFVDNLLWNRLNSDWDGCFWTEQQQKGLRCGISNRCVWSAIRQKTVYRGGLCASKLTTYGKPSATEWTLDSLTHISPSHSVPSPTSQPLSALHCQPENYFFRDRSSSSFCAELNLILPPNIPAGESFPFFILF